MEVKPQHLWIIALIRRLQALGPGRHLLIIDIHQQQGQQRQDNVDWTVTSLGVPEHQ